MKHTFHIFFYLSVLIISFTLGLIYVGPKTVSSVKNVLAGVFFSDSTTVEELRTKYSQARSDDGEILILIVPGHDNEFWGTEFKSLRENEINFELGQYLFDFLNSEDRYKAVLTQDSNGYLKPFKKYFEDEVSIKKYAQIYREIMDGFVQDGIVTRKIFVDHVLAPEKQVIRLYGLNKIANERNVDIVIHIHFNDVPGRKYNRPGKYDGFTIYVPERQYSNSKASVALAESIMPRLSKVFPVSSHPKESAGIVEDQELIAIGANNSLDPAVAFIEYGYIYDAPIHDEVLRSKVLKEAAYQTFLGINDFFEKSNNDLADLVTLPHLWGKNLGTGLKLNADVFALQTALLVEDTYPPIGRSKNDCPVTGTFKSCTEKAVKQFQKKHNIEPISGYVGPITRKKLNEIYGP